MSENENRRKDGDSNRDEADRLSRMLSGGKDDDDDRDAARRSPGTQGLSERLSGAVSGGKDDDDDRKGFGQDRGESTRLSNKLSDALGGTPQGSGGGMGEGGGAGGAPARSAMGPGAGAGLAAGAAAGAAAGDAAQVAALDSRLSALTGRVNLTAPAAQLNSLSAQIQSFPTEIANLRGRGYAFRAYLESKASVLQQQWQEAQARIQQFLQSEAAQLRAELNQAGDSLQQLRSGARGAAGQLGAVDAQLNQIEQRVQAAEGHINTLLAELSRETGQMAAQLTEIKWILDQTDEAGFQLNPGEAVYMAARAEWDNGSDKPDGVLFLTDQRLLFEQKEEVGGFLFVKGQHKQQLLWEVPLASVEQARAENQGLFGGKDIVVMKLGSGAPYGEIKIEVKGGVDCKLWAQQIKRATSGALRGDQAIQPDAELLDAIRKAPTQCQVCGATLPQVKAGDTQLQCKYCGAVIRL